MKISRLKEFLLRKPSVISVDTAYGKAHIYAIRDEDGRDKRLLEIGGGVQSATYLDANWTDLTFRYHCIFDRAFEVHKNLETVLMFGGGGFSYPKYLVSHHPHARIDVVEPDAEILQIARQYFFLDRLEKEYETKENKRLRIFNTEGRPYLKTCPDLYDLVLNDAFTGKTPAQTLASLEADFEIKQILKPHGIYMINVASALEGRHSALLKAQVRTLRQAFSYVTILPSYRNLPEDRDNYVLAASDYPYDFHGALDIALPSNASIIHDKGNITEQLARR